MNINITPADRSLRAMIGLAIVASPIMGLDTAPLNWLGLVPWATAVLGFSPLYHLLGISTCSPTSYRYVTDGIQINRPAAPNREAHA